MRRLGHPRFVAQGGDWGAVITDVLAWLIEKVAAVDVRDDCGRTPLWWATWQLRQGFDLAGGPNPRFVAVVRVLLAAGADPDIRDESGCSPDEAFRGSAGTACGRRSPTRPGDGPTGRGAWSP